MTRREQTSLALLLVLVGLGVALGYRLWHQASAIPAASSASATDHPVDTRLRTPATDVGPAVSVATPEDRSAEPLTGAFFAGVDPGKLASIRDDRTYLREERGAWLNLLDVLAQADPAALNKASLGRVTFAQLFAQPDVYRGKLVQVQGQVVRAQAARLAEPRGELQQYYQLWLRLDDNPHVPLVVHCLHLPADFPQGPQISEEARVTGFFYKRWAYPAQDGPRVAPLILAKDVQWMRGPAPAPVDDRPQGLSVAIVLAGAVVMALWIAITVWGKGRRRVRAHEPSSPVQISPPTEHDAP